MSDINRRSPEEILEKIEQNKWPQIAGVTSILALLVALASLTLQFLK